MSRSYSQQKAALTRAKKQGPVDVIEEVARAFAEFDSPTGYWPDDWSRWQRAGDDARFQLQLLSGFGWSR